MKKTPKRRGGKLTRRSWLRAAMIAGVPVAIPRMGRAATLGRFPYLQNITETSATVIWTTAEGGTGAVRFSEDRSQGPTIPGRVRELIPAETELATSYFRHSVELTGLKPNTLYFYRVLVDGVAVTQEELTFRTAGPGPFRFLVIGDSGAGSEEQRTLRGHMLKETISLLVHTGDMAYPLGRFVDYENNHFEVYKDLMKRCPFYPVPGNHGYMTRDAFPFVQVHQLPFNGVGERDRNRYYSFDWGNAHFIALDSNAPLARTQTGSTEMLDWLEADLKAHAGKYWKIAIFHHPPYAGGPNEADTLSILARNVLVPILERHGVQLVLCGHEHSYQRSYTIRDGAIVPANEGTVYMTSGGGGMYLYEVYPNPFVATGRSVHHYLRCTEERGRLAVEAVGLDGSVFDSVSLAPPPQFAANPARSVNARDGLFAPGGLVSLTGRNLGFEEQSIAMGTLDPLAGVTAAVEGHPVRLITAAPGLVNVQLPDGISGMVSLELKTPNGVAQTSFVITPTAPGLIVFTHTNGAFVSDENPASPGETLMAYAAGLGAWDGGRPANPVRIRVGSQFLATDRIDNDTGLAAVQRVLFTLPADQPAGTVMVSLEAGQEISQPFPVRIR